MLTADSVIGSSKRFVERRTRGEDNQFLTKVFLKMGEDFCSCDSEDTGGRINAFKEILEVLTESREYGKLINDFNYYQLFSKIVKGIIFTQRARNMKILGIVMLINCDELEKKTYMEAYAEFPYLREILITKLITPLYNTQAMSSFESSRRLQVFDMILEKEKEFSENGLVDTAMLILDTIDVKNIQTGLEIMKKLVRVSKEEDVFMNCFWKVIKVCVDSVDQEENVDFDFLFSVSNSLVDMSKNQSIYAHCCEELINILKKNDFGQKKQKLIFGILDNIKLRLSEKEDLGSRKLLRKALSFF